MRRFATEITGGGPHMAVFLFLLVVAAIVGYAIWARSAGSAQASVTTRADETTTRAVIDRSFNKAIWDRVQGPADYNFRPRARRGPPVISVSVAPQGDGLCAVELWPSSYSTTLGFAMNHATLVWRKKRAVVKKLEAL